MTVTLEAMQRALLSLVGVALSTLAQSAQAQSADHVRVHLDARDGVILQQKKGREWVDVCFAPCDRRVDGDARYRIEGPGVRPTNPFSLRATSLEKSETLVVRPSYVGTRNAGFVLVGVGAAGVFVAGVLAWVAVVSSENCGGSSIQSTTQCEVVDRNLIVTGLVTAISGAIVGGIGAVLAITNSHSTVKHMASDSTKPRVHFLASDVPFHWKCATEADAARSSSSATMILPIVSMSF